MSDHEKPNDPAAFWGRVIANVWIVLVIGTVAPPLLLCLAPLLLLIWLLCRFLIFLIFGW